MELPFIFHTEVFLYVILGIVVSIPAILLNIYLAPKLGLIDWPKARGVSDEQIPIVGHSIVLIALVIIGVICIFKDFRPWFLVTAAGMALVGHLDDRKPLSALDKLFFQLVCVGSVVLFDPLIYSAMAQKYGLWGSIWAVFFMMGLINAINFIDGIDGLAGLVLVVGCIGFIFFAAPSAGMFPYVVFSSILVGVMASFLYFNVLKRKGFLGNVGSYFFAYILAVLHLSVPMEASDPISRVSLTGLCFLVPIADSVMVVLARIFSLRSPFSADKGHLHHRLVQTGLPLRYILMNFGLIELTSAGVGVALVSHLPHVRFPLPLFLCLSQVAITAILIVLIEKSSKRRLQYYFQRLDVGEPVFFMKYVLCNTDGTLVSRWKLERIEAKVSAEIRVTDFCFLQEPNTLFLVLLRSRHVPLKGIENRLEAIFRKQSVVASLVLEQGEFLRESVSSRKSGKGRRAA